MITNCSPCYTGRPPFVPGPDCFAPVFTTHRSRLFAGGTFFRSKLNVPGNSDFQGVACNDISLEVTQLGNDFTLTVRFETIVEETYPVTQTPVPTGSPPVISCSPSGIDLLRTATASSDFISMPPRGVDIFDTGVDDPCLSAFSETSMSGGSGPPSNPTFVGTIRTGPERSILIIQSIEDSIGQSVFPPTSQRVQQYNWDTLIWESYIPNADCRPLGDPC